MCFFVFCEEGWDVIEGGRKVWDAVGGEIFGDVWYCGFRVCHGEAFESFEVGWAFMRISCSDGVVVLIVREALKSTPRRHLPAISLRPLFQLPHHIRFLAMGPKKGGTKDVKASGSKSKEPKESKDDKKKLKPATSINVLVPPIKTPTSYSATQIRISSVTSRN